MKRFYQLLVVAAVTLFVPVAASTPASAAFQCEAGFTGPNSNNMCVSEEEYACSVENNNDVTITNQNNQQAASGSVDVDDNGSGGGAVSGTASNGNQVNFTVSIENGETCLASVVVPAEEIPETPETPQEPTPGRGGAEAPVQPTQTATPVALPTTSGSKAPEVLALVGSAALTAGAAFAYRRLLS